MVDNNDVIAILNELIETSKDGEEGFRSSAENVEDGRLKEFFLRRSQEVGESVSELQTIVRSLGGIPINATSIGGTLHRRWIDLKTALTNDNNMAVLIETELGENIAVAAYESALELELPAEIRAVIVRQLEVEKRKTCLVKQLRAVYDAEAALR